MLSYFKPDYLQIHGEISITAIEAIKKNYQLKLVRALSHSELNQKIINELENIVDFILIDSAAKADGYGGSGKVFDWLSLKNYNFNKDYFLSGGLSKNNIKRALELSQAKFIDLSSALEEPKGHKSSAKIIEFFDNFNNEFLQ